MRKLSFIFLLVLATAGSTTLYRTHPSITDPVGWEQFLECSADEGDAGCEACWYEQFGYYADEAFYPQNENIVRVIH